MYPFHHHRHHKRQGLDPLIRSVSRVTAARVNASSVFQLYSFLVVCSGMISKGFGFVAFFAGVKVSSVCVQISCLVCLQSVVRGVCSHYVSLPKYLFYTLSHISCIMKTRAKNWILRPYLVSARWIEEESTILITDTFCVLSTVFVFFFENRLEWQFAVRLSIFTICTRV